MAETKVMVRLLSGKHFRQGEIFDKDDVLEVSLQEAKSFANKFLILETEDANENESEDAKVEESEIEEEKPKRRRRNAKK